MNLPAISFWDTVHPTLTGSGESTNRPRFHFYSHKLVTSGWLILYDRRLMDQLRRVITDWGNYAAYLRDSHFIRHALGSPLVRSKWPLNARIAKPWTRPVPKCLAATIERLAWPGSVYDAKSLAMYAAVGDDKRHIKYRNRWRVDAKLRNRNPPLRSLRLELPPIPIWKTKSISHIFRRQGFLMPIGRDKRWVY